MKLLKPTTIFILTISILLLSQTIALGLSTREGIITERTIIDPSVQYIHYHRTLPSGSGVELHIVKIRLDDDTLEIRPALEGGKIKSSAILSDIARSENAIAAINGGFFFGQDGRKLPVGELVINGNLLSHSDILRGCFIVDGDGQIILDVLTIDAYLNPSDYYEPIKIYAMNVPPGGIVDAVHIYNRFWGTQTPLAPGCEVVVDDGVVAALSPSGPTPIPEDGFVISFRGGWAPTADRFVEGLGVGIIYDFDGVKGAIRHMLTGGPMFIEDGWFRDFSDEYRFSGDVKAPAHRSAICRTFNNEILLVCTRGNPLTISQFAKLLTDLNVREAVGLDGGGSSGMWIDGISTPSPQRPVPNAIVLVHKDPSSTNGNISTGGLWRK